jgi:uncharacterized protein YbjT (DUF2867 family)
MRVVIAGAHGKIARKLIPLLAARGDSVVGLIRNPDHAGEVAALGAEPVVLDLEQTIADDLIPALEHADAAVFAAGAGPGSGAERKLTLDRDGAIKLLQAATRAGVPRYLIISSVGAENPPGGDDVFSVYLRAKAEADAAVESSDRDWTIVRPGRLTDDPGTGRVRIDTRPFRGKIPREDVAAVLDVLLRDPRAIRQIRYLNAGETPIEAAINAALDHS